MTCSILLVKIWVTNMAYSVGIVNAEANVCAVRFHPASRYYLAYGCAGLCVCVCSVVCSVVCVV